MGVRLKFLLILLLTAPLVVWADIEVKQAWMRASPAGLSSTAYMHLFNRGKSPVKINGFSSSEYSIVKLHKTSIINGVSRMDSVDSIVIKPGEKLKLSPGGYHLMMLNPKKKSKSGDKIPLVIKYEGKELKVDLLVKLK